MLPGWLKRRKSNNLYETVIRRPELATLPRQQTHMLSGSSIIGSDAAAPAHAASKQTPSPSRCTTQLLHEGFERAAYLGTSSDAAAGGFEGSSNPSASRHDQSHAVGSGEDEPAQL